MAIYTLKILNTARFLKHVWPFYNMHERVKNNLDKFIGCSCSVKISGLGKQAFNDILTLYRQMVTSYTSYRNQSFGLQCKPFNWFLFDGNIGLRKGNRLFSKSN